jgi:hypothetical protein
LILKIIFFIKYIYNLITESFKLIRYILFIYKNLKVEYYNKKIIKAFTLIKELLFLSLLFILFINDFGIYYNIY